MSRFIFSVLVSGVLATVGCADYAYQARTTSGTRTAVASYAIPSQAPHGRVLLRSSGIGPLPAPASPGERGLHVVMVVNNDGNQPWTIDTRRETVVLPDGSAYAPTLARAAGAATPTEIVEVPAGVQRAIDLYYALPAGHERDQRLPEFAARWQVDTGHGPPMRGQATFQRVNVSGPTMPCGAHATQYCLAGYAS